MRFILNVFATHFAGTNAFNIPLKGQNAISLTRYPLNLLFSNVKKNITIQFILFGRKIKLIYICNNPLEKFIYLDLLFDLMHIIWFYILDSQIFLRIIIPIFLILVLITKTQLVYLFSLWYKIILLQAVGYV